MAPRSRHASQATTERRAWRPPWLWIAGIAGVAVAMLVPGWALTSGNVSLPPGIARPADARWERFSAFGDEDDAAASADRGVAAAVEAGGRAAVERRAAAAERRAAPPVVTDPRLTLTAEANVAPTDIPPVALRAYTMAEEVLGISDPVCGLRWWLLAAIGRVESNHGQYNGVVLGPDGFGNRPIRGVPLDGTGGVGRLADTDGGRIDGDPHVDRAVGPMQFVPATWLAVGVDADGDGQRDPDNFFDAAVGAGVYLCTGETNLNDPAQLDAALGRYNPSPAYVSLVSRLARAYQRGDGLGDLGLGLGVPGWNGDWAPASEVPPFTFDPEVEVVPLGPLPPANPGLPLAAPLVPHPSTSAPPHPPAAHPSPAAQAPKSPRPSGPPPSGQRPAGQPPAGGPSTPPGTPPHGPAHVAPGGTASPPIDPAPTGTPVGTPGPTRPPPGATPPPTGPTDPGGTPTGAGTPPSGPGTPPTGPSGQPTPPTNPPACPPTPGTPTPGTPAPGSPTPGTTQPAPPPAPTPTTTTTTTTPAPATTGTPPPTGTGGTPATTPCPPDPTAPTTPTTPSTPPPGGATSEPQGANPPVSGAAGVPLPAVLGSRPGVRPQAK